MPETRNQFEGLEEFQGNLQKLLEFYEVEIRS